VSGFPDRPADTARVVTWNLWWRFGDEPARRVPAIADTLASLDADVVCLQEVYGDDTGADDATALGDRLGGHVVRNEVRYHQGRSFGNAIVSRWPVLRAGQHRLPGADGRPGHRTAVWAVVEAPCGELPVVCTHLAFRFDESALRQTQAAAVAALAAELRGDDPGERPPVVLCGDLNAVPDSDELRQLTGRSAPAVPGLVFTDAWPQVRDDAGHTWVGRNPYLATAAWPERRLDYVLLSWPRRVPVGKPVQAFLVGDGPVGGVWPSDHLGVAVDLTVAG
jgi:endonuclease/exonuclease/phosphatase family metal-dependent hydrolase